MKKFYARPFLRILFVLLLALLLAACGGEEPTPTPVPPTATTAPTDTPVPPTNTPAPTATPEPSPEPSATSEPAANFVDFESAAGGYTLQYPENWFTSDLGFFTVFASNEELLDEAEPGEEGGLLLVVTGETAEFESDDPAEVLNQAIAEFELGEDTQIVDGPTTLTIQGQDAATAVINATSDEDTPLTALVAVIINGDYAAIAISATPSETEEEFLPVFESIVNTIEVTEPAVAEIPAELPETEGVLLYGDVVQGAVGEEGPSAWSFIGLEGETIDIIVEPTGDLDAVVDVLDESGTSILENGEVDDAFDTEEILGLTLPSSGEFSITIRGFADATGDYELTLREAGEGVTEGGEPTIGGEASGTLEYGGIATGSVSESGTTSTWVFSGQEGNFVDVTVAPISEDFDLVVDVLDTSGVSILQEGAVDDSFDVERIRALELPASGEYAVTVQGFEDATGEFELLVDLANGGQIGSVVTASDTIEEADEDHAFPFTALAGELVTAVVDPEAEFDVVLEVYNEDTDELLLEVDDTTGFEELAFEVPEDGNYYFAVSGFEGATGTYDITLLGPPTVLLELAFGDTVRGQFGEDNFIEYWFSPLVDDTIVIKAVALDEETDIVLEILDVDDNVVAEIDDNFSGEGEELSYTFTTEDLHIIRISDFFESQGRFEMVIDFE